MVRPAEEATRPDAAPEPPATPFVPTPLGWLIGVVAAAITLGVGEFVAAFVRPAAAPVIAVGNRLITLTPQNVKNQGIEAAGTNDKLFLILGILLVLALVGAAIGSVALRHLWAGLVGVALVGAFGVYCALTANASRDSDVIPTVVGTLVGMAVLALLVELSRGERLHEDRRTFLIGTAAVAGLAAAGGFGGRALQHARFDVEGERAKVKLPDASSREGVPAGVDLGRSDNPWRTPNGDFYRIDTALAIPQIPPTYWRLRIHGMVDREVTISYSDLLKRPLVERWITLCCVSNEVGGNLIGNALWRGAFLTDLLREAGIHPDADQLLMTSDDGMTIGAPAQVVMDGRDSLLAVGMNGKPLPIEHGFPVRVVVPGLYGYTSACKWVVDIKATTFAKDRAYWVKGGWEPHPAIKVASRIDTPNSSQTVNTGETTVIAGVAWDQHVGVSRVEVQVGDGPWQPARLATVPSTDTWRQWVFPWTPQEAGTYKIRVRAVDGAGTVQDSAHRDPYPGASSGYHTITLHAVT